jgi:hypothetical protein
VVLMLDVPVDIAARMAPVATVGMAVGLVLSCAAGWRYTRALGGSA